MKKRVPEVLILTNLERMQAIDRSQRTPLPVKIFDVDDDFLKRIIDKKLEGNTT